MVIITMECCKKKLMNWTISIYLLDELDKWAFITQVADLVLCRNFSASLQTEICCNKTVKRYGSAARMDWNATIGKKYQMLGNVQQF